MVLSICISTVRKSKSVIRKVREYSFRLPSIFWQDIIFWLVIPYLAWIYGFALIRCSLWLYLCSEVVMYFVILPWQIQRISKLRVPSYPYPYVKDRVTDFYKWALSFMINDFQGFKQFCCGWLCHIHFHEITFDSMIAVCFNMMMEKNLPRDLHLIDEEEMEMVRGMVRMTEKMMGWKFRDGPIQDKYGMLVDWGYKCCKFPILFYGLNYFQNYVNTILMRYHGYRHLWMDGIEYWHRPAQGPPTGGPQWFFHGIGIGLLPYYPVYSRLSKTRESIVPDMRWVQLRLFQEKPMMHVLQRNFQKIMLRHGYCTNAYNKLTLISHSYGSFVASHMCNTTGRNVDVIEKTIFIDPAAAAAHWPRAVSAVHYNPNNYLDCDMSWSLHYQVRWWEAGLRADLLPPNSTIIVSEKDEIVPSAFVYRTAKKTSCRVILYKGEGHGQFLFEEHGGSRFISHTGVTKDDCEESNDSSVDLDKFHEFNDEDLENMIEKNRKITRQNRKITVAGLENAIFDTYNMMNQIENYL